MVMLQVFVNQTAPPAQLQHQQQEIASIVQMLMLQVNLCLRHANNNNGFV